MKRTALDVEATAGNPPLTELVDLYLLRCHVEGKSRQHGEFSPVGRLTAAG